MHRAVSNWSRVLIVPIVSLSLVAYPHPGFAASPGTLSFSNVDRGNGDIELAPLPSVSMDDVSVTFWELKYRAYQAAEEYAPARYRFDTAVEALDYEPEGAFYFVRDNIRFDPYDGVLRGAEGALGGQAANAYDRSLLLKKLLEDMGVEARLVFGTLDAERAARLLTRALDNGDEADSIVPLARVAGFPAAMRARLFKRANRDFNWLDAALDSESGTARATLVTSDAVAQHVWVQAKLGANWEDLDSSFKEAKPGDVYGKVTGYASDYSPDDEHIVHIQVVAETLEKGELAEHVLLEYELTARDATRTRTYLTFVPENPTMGGALTEALGVEKGYVPVLSVDGDLESGERIPGVTGEVSESKEFFYGKERAELSALYVDIKAGLKSSKEGRARGVLIDRLPSSSRLSSSPRVDDLEPMEFVDGKPANFQSIHQILVSNGGSNPHTAAIDVGLGIHFIGEHLLQAESLEKFPLDSVMWPIAMFRNAQLAVNERLLDDALNDRPDMRFFIGEPRVYLMTQSASSRDGEELYGQSIDLLHDPLQAIAAADASESAVRDRRVWHGVVQSSFETTLLDLAAVAYSEAVESQVSASLESTGQGTVIAGTDDPRLPDNPPSALLDDLQAGKTVVTSSSALAAGASTWWSVSPDGTTRAMLAPGLGGGKEWFWAKALPEPKKSMFEPPRYNAQRAWYGERNWQAREAWNKSAEAADKQYRKEATRRTKNSAPKRRSGGGSIEYGIVLEVSLYSAVGAAGILALTIVALACGGMLLMVGYVWFSEGRRKAGGYWGPPKF